MFKFQFPFYRELPQTHPVPYRKEKNRQGTNLSKLFFPSLQIDCLFNIVLFILFSLIMLQM
jgi:hypothetical protein